MIQHRGGEGVSQDVGATLSLCGNQPQFFLNHHSDGGGSYSHALSAEKEGLFVPVDICGESGTFLHIYIYKV